MSAGESDRRRRIGIDVSRRADLARDGFERDVFAVHDAIAVGEVVRVVGPGLSASGHAKGGGMSPRERRAARFARRAPSVSRAIARDPPPPVAPRLREATRWVRLCLPPVRSTGGGGSMRSIETEGVLRRARYLRIKVKAASLLRDPPGFARSSACASGVRRSKRVAFRPLRGLLLTPFRLGASRRSFAASRLAPPPSAGQDGGVGRG
jgi:hypothetical protein